MERFRRRSSPATPATAERNTGNDQRLSRDASPVLQNDALTLCQDLYKRGEGRSRALLRQLHGGGGRQKARRRLAKAHATVADQRLDHLHKLGPGSSVRTKQLCWRI